VLGWQVRISVLPALVGSFLIITITPTTPPQFPYSAGDLRWSFSPSEQKEAIDIGSMNPIIRYTTIILHNLRRKVENQDPVHNARQGSPERHVRRVGRHVVSAICFGSKLGNESVSETVLCEHRQSL
jgi:hypothetical protein